MNYGFVKVAAAIPSMRVADTTYNIQQIESLIIQAEGRGVEIICFPELSVCGYTCGDLFAQQLLLDNCEEALFKLLDFTRALNIICIVGAPVAAGGLLLNCAVVVQGGRILGIVPKTFLPNYKEFYEKRWFASGATLQDTEVRLCGQTVPLSRNAVFHTQKTAFGIELCEDLWAPIPPSSALALKGAEIIFNLSATNELICKHQYLLSLIAQQSSRCIAGYVYSSCGFGESTQDVVFAGNAIIYENGTQLAHSERFSLGEQLIISEIDTERLLAERRVNTTFADSVRLVNGFENVGFLDKFDNVDKSGGRALDIQCQTVSPSYDFELTRWVNPHPFVPTGSALTERCEEIFAIQVEGLAKRIVHTNARTAVVGISGGLDSTLALLVCVKTMDKLGRSRKDIVGITMPGFGTTDRTYRNALSLMRSLGVTIKEISIKDACTQHFKDIGHDIDVHDVTYENGQARERTQILMDVANQMGGFVVGTGDLSELALGWATYNADHMSNYGVNCSIPKTLVKYLVHWVAMTSVDEESRATLLDIIDTPISPELIPADENGNIRQKTEDLVGPYELHDFFLYHFLRLGFRPAKILYLAEKAFIKQDYRKVDFSEPSDYSENSENSENSEISKNSKKSKNSELSKTTLEVGSYDEETIRKWLTTFCRRFFTQQFKRSCLPDGPKVGSVSLSPRGDWRMPSDASSADWLKDLEDE